MTGTINRLTLQYEKIHGHRPNLLYLNTKKLEELKKQLLESNLDIISQLIGMEIIIVENLKEPYVSWAQINWKHQSIA